MSNAPQMMARRPLVIPLGGHRGLTLIELSVSLVIISIIVVAAATSISNIRRADLKKTGGIMAASMRYTYNLAIINRTPYRLVIDMDKGEFWGEEMKSQDPCDRFMPEKGDGADRLDRTRPREAKPDDEDAKPKPSYGMRKDNLLSKRKLPLGVRVTGVMTTHDPRPRTEGQAYIHFFPGGYAEKAYIWLGIAKGGDPDAPVEPQNTIALDGLMGTVERHGRPLDEQEFLKDLDL